MLAGTCPQGFETLIQWAKPLQSQQSDRLSPLGSIVIPERRLPRAKLRGVALESLFDLLPEMDKDIPVALEAHQGIAANAPAHLDLAKLLQKCS